MRVVAILATFNEERFIAPCLENLFSQGIEAYLIDNGSTDETVAIARRYLGKGLVGIENFPRDQSFHWAALLKRKEELANTIDADWFMHVDADETFPSPRPGISLAQVFGEVEMQGFNAVNFIQFTFIPTIEAPDHDHPQFIETMRWYYPFIPEPHHLIRAWKRPSVNIELARSGGHQVNFPGRRLYPQSFPMRHFHFLSVPHALRKYALRHYDRAEVENGWHGWRATLKPDMIKLPSQAELRTYISDDQLDASNPRTHHCFLDATIKEVGPGRQSSRMVRIANSLGWKYLTRFHKSGISKTEKT